MDRTKEQFEKLLNKYVDKSCTLEELKELFTYMNLSEYQERMKIIMDEHFKTLDPAPAAQALDWEKMYAVITTAPENSKKVMPLWSFVVSIAAAVLVLLSIGILIWDNQSENGRKEEVTITKTKKDIAPGGNRAVLKLADGTEIILDGHATGLLASEGNTQIRKAKDGMLLYDAAAAVVQESVAEPRINTLTTPSGGQYVLILPDQTKVWLNAASSISFPSAFNGAERRVTLTGEAYFEVAKDKDRPFKVKAGAAEVRVLGTHFNIMAYADEGQMQVSLAEGAVRVDLENDTQVLSPGQQALIKKGANRIILKDIDIDEATNWKNGLFQFDNTPIDQVMRQIKRWYNVDVVYQGVKPDLYITGMISRRNNVSKILALIEETGGVNFEIGDKQIIVNKQKEATMKR